MCESVFNTPIKNTEPGRLTYLMLQNSNFWLGCMVYVMYITDMIDLELYRARIGSYASCKLKVKGGICQKNVCDTNQVMYLSGYTCLYLLYMLFITYVVPILLSFIYDISKSGPIIQQVSIVPPVFWNFGVVLPPIADSHT